MEERLKGLPDKLYFQGLLPALAALPRRLGYSAARQVGRRIARQHPDALDLISRNIAQAIPDGQSPKSPQQMAKLSFEHLTCEDLDAFYYPFWNQDNLPEYFTFEGLDHLDSAVERGRGAILLTGHIGSICAGLVSLGIKGYPVTHVSRDYPGEKDILPAFRKYALLKLRWLQARTKHDLIWARSGTETDRSSVVLDIQRALMANKLVSMALDIPAYMVHDHLPVPFLGRQACMAATVIRLALLSESPLIPYVIRRQSDAWHRHLLQIGPPLDLSRGLEATLRDSVLFLENAILEEPEQWFAWASLTHFWNSEAC